MPETVKFNQIFCLAGLLIIEYKIPCQDQIKHTVFKKNHIKGDLKCSKN